MSTKTVVCATWITAVTAVLAAISFLMLALSMHHSTRSVMGYHTISGKSGGGLNGLGLHDGDI